MSQRARFWRSVMRKVFREKKLSVKAERIRSLRNSRFHLPFPRCVRVNTMDMDGLTSVSIRPVKADERRVILYLHGGGYVSGSIVAYLMLCVPMAKTLGTGIFLPEYRLAPEDPFPAALEDALKAYRWLLARGYRAGDIVVAGDSAGGGLSLALVQALREAGEALPAALVCLSPWADLTHSNASHRDNADRELLLDTGMLSLWASYYAAGTDLVNPFVSPVFADYRGFPPLYILVGGDELLLDDARSVAERAAAAGVDVELSVWDELWHVWPILGSLIPESRLAFEAIQRFLRSRFAPAGL